MKKYFLLCLCVFSINAFADEVGLTWYNNGTQMSGGPSSCTVGGTFVPPTPPSRTGYIFAGWHILSCADKITKLNSSTPASGNASSGYGYKSVLSNYTQSRAANYGLTGWGVWAVEFSYGVVYGRARCSSTNGTNNTTGTPVSSNGQYCWCQATGFSPAGSNYTQGPQCTISELGPTWVIVYNGFSSYNLCSYRCSDRCAYNGVMSSAAFRAALFSSAGQ